MKHPRTPRTKSLVHRGKTAPKKGHNPGRAGPSQASTGHQTLWLWGTHAVLAALHNPARTRVQLHASKNAAVHLPPGTPASIAGPRDIAALLPDGAVHQGLALLTRPLPPAELEAILQRPRGVAVMLDGVTDPHNVGAILRSSAAFGACAVIVQDRKSPPAGGVLAKAAAGALERLPLIGVVNLARTLDDLADAGWFNIGLAGQSPVPLQKALGADKLCLVLGAEGKGLRPNVAKHCSQIARIPISAGMESLNVSTAAAIALYEAGRR